MSAICSHESYGSSFWSFKIYCYMALIRPLKSLRLHFLATTMLTDLPSIFIYSTISARYEIRTCNVRAQIFQLNSLRCVCAFVDVVVVLKTSNCSFKTFCYFLNSFSMSRTLSCCYRIPHMYRMSCLQIVKLWQPKAFLMCVKNSWPRCKTRQ